MKPRIRQCPQLTISTHRHSWDKTLGRIRFGVIVRDASIFLFGFAAWMLSQEARADNFSAIYYDANQDQLVVTMAYQGTNPDHVFSLQWGQCRNVKGSNVHEIPGEVLDSQWQDQTNSNFTKTTRFSLVGFACRPAKVTLRTAPQFHYTFMIPAVSGAPK